jgi:Helicase HerA, central domain
MRTDEPNSLHPGAQGNPGRPGPGPDEMSSLAALAALTFNWTRTLNDVWAPAPFHVDGLHADVAQDIARGIDEAVAGAANPLGLVIQGQRGVGKTHLLGWTREQVQRAGGYFFLVGDLSAKAFWEELLGCVVEQLLPLPDGSRDQLHALLGALADRVGLEPVVRDSVTGQTAPTPVTLRVFIRELRRLDPRIGLICQDTARALVLLASPDQDDQDVGYYFMTGNEVNFEDRRRWGIHATRSVPRLLITELSRLLALTGPTVIAIDQIDALIDELVGQPGEAQAQSRGLADMATGLMTLRDRSFRTLTIVSSLPESWNAIRDYGTDTVTDRFRAPRQLRNIPSADIGRLMIEKRFRADYARAGFEPPYLTWPIRPEAFEDAGRYSARALLKRVEAHVSACLQARAVTELSRLDFGADDAGTDAASAGRPAAAGQPDLAAPQGAPAAEDGPAAPAAATSDTGAAAGDSSNPGAVSADAEFALLDARFAALCADPDVRARAAAALDPKTEDTVMPALLDAGFEAWARELGAGADHPFAQDSPPGKNPRLHASLRLVLDLRTERHRRWAFRAIAAAHPNAVQSRLRKAAEASGLDAGRPDRHLFVLRNDPWPTGKVTEQETASFAAKGGIVLPAAPADLAVFAALAVLTAERHPALNAWLADRKPAHATQLLSAALWDAAEAAGHPAASATGPDPAPAPATAASPEPAGPGAEPQDPARSPAAPAPTIRVGLPAAGRPGATLDLASLRRHLAIFAGTGSGKTVLLRRVIEECALLGVSSIVLDPNNDLARLGDPWPSAPDPWLDGDAGRAQSYLAETDVVIWTPRRAGGRPLTFQPLPDFGVVIDEVDEFNAAVDAAVEALAPRVGLARQSGRAPQEKAVLTEAMRYFARGAGRDLGVFIDILADLPEHVSTQTRAVQIAADLADRLRAVRATDPLFGGAGETADPGLLLTPPPGKRARISVISKVGMASLEQWQGFVNQLQMSLFSWVKRNPAQDKPLAGLLVMDEAQDLVPSSGTTACSESTRRLASQARKYGLGLLFATQSPKALHNSIPGNALTQFFGLLSAPAQIEAARDFARAKGGDVPAVGRLAAGEFYLATEGTGFRRVRSPFCLSYHPDGPLPEDEVLARAAVDVAAAGDDGGSVTP